MIEKAHPDFKVKYYQFDERMMSDSCWSVQTGPDGRIYLACCVEHTGGQTVTVVRYNPVEDKLDYLFDMDEVTGDLRDSGRATQCKIHYSFAPDPNNDLLYCATHLSGAPKGESSYNPWAGWHDPVRSFRGSYLTAFNTKTDKVESSELFIPKEGCRCLCFDRERRLLYALTYPRDHFVVYDLEKRELRDLGRLGSVNSQCIFLDANGMAYTCNDQGHFIRYNPNTDRLQTLPFTYAHEDFQTSSHGVLYDAVKDPSVNAVYMVPWKAHPHLMRFWPDEGEFGLMEDLGRLTDAGSPYLPMSVNLCHVGGLVFGNDGFLYYVKSFRGSNTKAICCAMAADTIAWLCRVNPISLKHEEICTLQGGAGRNHYVSRGAKDSEGNFYFGKILAKPAGVYRVKVNQNKIVRSNHEYLRYWG
jgi:hypothetical protein